MRDAGRAPMRTSSLAPHLVGWTGDPDASRGLVAEALPITEWAVRDAWDGTAVAGVPPVRVDATGRPDVADLARVPRLDGPIRRLDARRLLHAAPEHPRLAAAPRGPRGLQAARAVLRAPSAPGGNLDTAWAGATRLAATAQRRGRGLPPLER